MLGHGRTVVSIVGFFWFVVSAFLLKSLAGNTARQGALLQEMFDTALFHMPWRATVAGDPIPDPDVRRLARQLPRGGKKDKRITDGWYDPTHDVHHPYDVFIAQEQNLAEPAFAAPHHHHASIFLLVVFAAIPWRGKVPPCLRRQPRKPAHRRGVPWTNSRALVGGLYGVTGNQHDGAATECGLGVRWFGLL
ncbi:S-4TM family putative pore-forming effector [Actinomadura fulvescens]|uniref:S-4TM family putative pore-forming effector n=1 Tax=Actinomadura fulvescens TaxID=46160 RepID=UPI0039788DDE